MDVQVNKFLKLGSSVAHQMAQLMYLDLAFFTTKCRFDYDFGNSFFKVTEAKYNDYN